MKVNLIYSGLEEVIVNLVANILKKSDLLKLFEDFSKYDIC